MKDADLIDFAIGELEKIGIVSHKYFIIGWEKRLDLDTDTSLNAWNRIKILMKI